MVRLGWPAAGRYSGRQRQFSFLLSDCHLVGRKCGNHCHFDADFVAIAKVVGQSPHAKTATGEKNPVIIRGNPTGSQTNPARTY